MTSVVPSKNIELMNSVLEPRLTTAEAKDREQVKEISRDFEAVFNGIVLKSMRSSIPKSDFLNGGNAEDIYRSLLDAEYSKLMVNGGQNSLAGKIEAQLLDSMEKTGQIKKAGAGHKEYLKAQDFQPKNNKLPQNSGKGQIALIGKTSDNDE